MFTSIVITTPHWAQEVQAWRQASGAGAQDALLYQGRLFVKDCVNLTPPQGLGNAARQKGENAIKGDIFGRGISSRSLPLFFAAESMFDFRHFKAARGMPAGRILFAGKSGVYAVADQNFKPNPSADEMKTEHYQHRDRRGRVATTGAAFTTMGNFRWVNRWMVAKENIENYFLSVIAKVGREKAGWGPAAKQFGFQLPLWIRRHLDGARGSVDMSRFNSGSPSITIRNYARGIGEQAHVIQSALKKSAQRMRKDAKWFVLGKKSWGHVRAEWKAQLARVKMEQ